MPSTPHAYRSQRRADRGAYERYLRGMDASMRQKVALTAAYLLSEGKVADMGMGSGTGSEALAALYPALDVVGVDVDPTMVELARARFHLPNLDFVQGDIAQSVFESESLEGIVNSSVLHHVTSFNDYDSAQAERAVQVQAQQLKPNGVIIVRDFLDPGPGSVLLDLPADDGDTGDDPRTCSTARLLERFAREYRPLSPRPGFELERVQAGVDGGPPLAEGFVRFRLTHTLAAEFVLRKDYRADWESEVKEAYTYLTQHGFEQLFAALGLRVLTSCPIRNPWIVRHRFNGKLALWDEQGRPLEPPATNYIIVGERVPPGEGVTLEQSTVEPSLGYLRMEHFAHAQSGRVMDVVCRPHPTVDIVPWFEQEGDLFVLARGSYPRPILGVDGQDSRSLDGSRGAGYVTEPLIALQTEQPMGTTVEQALRTDAGIASENIHHVVQVGPYCPSPGGIQELVRATLVRIDPVFASSPLENRSGFSAPGRVKAIEARQLLRAAQVGGLPDARLELNTYDLLLRQGVDPGPWIGEAIALQTDAPAREASLTSLLEAGHRRCFVPAEQKDSPGFMELRCHGFVERDASGRQVGACTLEFVVPSSLSRYTLTTALLRRRGDHIWLGVDDDDLAAAQALTGNSGLLVTPAWRLPSTTRTLRDAVQWVRQRLQVEYGADTGEAWELGGRYCPSPGLTPELAYPFAFEVRQEGPAERTLHWVALAELVSRRGALLDGHLRIAALRAAHALGLIAHEK